MARELAQAWAAIRVDRAQYRAAVCMLAEQVAEPESGTACLSMAIGRNAVRVAIISPVRELTDQERSISIHQTQMFGCEYPDFAKRLGLPTPGNRFNGVDASALTVIERTPDMPSMFFGDPAVAERLATAMYTAGDAAPQHL